MYIYIYIGDSAIKCASNQINMVMVRMPNILWQGIYLYIDI